MTNNRRLALILASLATTILVIGNWGISIARAATANLVAQSQLRRTIDPSPRGPTGTILLKESNGKQFVSVTVKGLSLVSLGTSLQGTNSFNTNDFIFLVAPLDRTSSTKGNWSRMSGPTNAAPEQFGTYVTNITDLAGSSIDIISAPPSTNIINGVTNIVNGVTNIVNGVTNITGGATVIVGGITGLFFNAYLWAPIPELVANPALSNFSKHAKLTLPDPPVPSARAAGNVKVQFNAAQGRSVLDIQASGLLGGQVYSVWLANDLGNTNFSNVGTMTLNKSGTNARFLRDTKFGDPLPEQLPDTSQIRGRAFVIEDDFHTSTWTA
jgi:hypothetical protein